jgi:hypothetical protein
MQTIPAIQKTNSASFFHFVYFLCHARVSATFSEIVSKNKHSGVFAIFFGIQLASTVPLSSEYVPPAANCILQKDVPQPDPTYQNY